MKKKAMRRALRGAFYAPLYVVMALVVSGCANNPAPANSPASADGRDTAAFVPPKVSAGRRIGITTMLLRIVR